MRALWLVPLAAACHGSSDRAPAPVASVAPAVTPTVASLESSRPTPLPAPTITTDWCIGGVSALDEDVCYVLPKLAADRPRSLLVYLHGIVPPLPDSAQKTKVEGVVLEASTRAGVAALIPRGRRGIGPTQARDWWAWPTTADAVAALTPSIVERWVAAKKKLEALTGAPFERTYLAGSSNGAYFVAELAARGDLPSSTFPVDGFGAMSGGGAGALAADRMTRLERRPFYVGYGTYDDETKTNVGSLVAALRAARWPVRVAEHPFGHGANEAYLDEAFAFWAAPE